MSNWSHVQWVPCPCWKVALPCDMEKVARCPEKDDGQLTEMGGKYLLVQALLRHAIMTLKVMSSRNAIPEPPSGWVLCKTLAKLWEFCCHSPLYVLLSFWRLLLTASPPPQKGGEGWWRLPLPKGGGGLGVNPRLASRLIDQGWSASFWGGK